MSGNKVSRQKTATQSVRFTYVWYVHGATWAERRVTLLRLGRFGRTNVRRPSCRGLKFLHTLQNRGVEYCRSGISLQGYSYSPQLWKLDTVTPYGAKGRLLCCPASSIHYISPGEGQVCIRLILELLGSPISGFWSCNTTHCVCRHPVAWLVSLDQNWSSGMWYKCWYLVTASAVSIALSFLCDPGLSSPCQHPGTVAGERVPWQVGKHFGLFTAFDSRAWTPDSTLLKSGCQ